MIGAVFRREMRAFTRNNWLMVGYVALPVVLAGMMILIMSSMREPLVRSPEMASLMVRKSLTILLIAYSLLSVMHLAMRSMALEKSNGLLDTLLTTPLEPRDLVWGKALHLGLLGFLMGALISAATLISLVAVTGDASLVTRISGLYWLYALGVVPVFLLGVFVAVAVTSMIADARIIMVVFTMGISGVFFAGTFYSSQTAEHALMIGLGLVGLAGHGLWWWFGNKLPRERFLS